MLEKPSVLYSFIFTHFRLVAKEAVMMLESQKGHINTLLTETITLLCKNGLSFDTEFSIEALIGITLDKQDVFLININETILTEAVRHHKDSLKRKESSENYSDVSDSSFSARETPSRKQHRRKKKLKRNSREEAGVVTDSPLGISQVPGTRAGSDKIKQERSHDVVSSGIPTVTPHPSMSRLVTSVTSSILQTKKLQADTTQTDVRPVEAIQGDIQADVTEPLDWMVDAIQGPSSNHGNRGLPEVATSTQVGSMEWPGDGSPSAVVSEGQVKLEKVDLTDGELMADEWYRNQAGSGNFPYGKDMCIPSELGMETASFAAINGPIRDFINGDRDCSTRIENLPKENESTSKTTQWALNLVREWFVEHSMDPDFERLEATVLDSALQQFYQEVRTKKGELYSASAMRCVRCAVYRHLLAAPLPSPLDILHDDRFLASNDLITRMYFDNPELQSIKSLEISVADMAVLKEYFHGGLTTPRILQEKVFFDLILNFGHQNRLTLREMRKDSLVVVIGANSKRYLTTSEASGLVPKDPREGVIMICETEDPLCPVVSYLSYTSHLNEQSETFWQQPKAVEQLRASSEEWYKVSSLGVNALSHMMASISVHAQLSYKYNNQCLSATKRTVRLRQHSPYMYNTPSGTPPHVPLNTPPHVPLNTPPHLPLNTSPHVPLNTPPHVPLNTLSQLPPSTPHVPPKLTSTFTSITE